MTQRIIDKLRHHMESIPFFVFSQWEDHLGTLCKVRNDKTNDLTVGRG